MKIFIYIETLVSEVKTNDNLTSSTDKETIRKYSTNYQDASKV